MKRLISTIILAQLTFLNADNYSISLDGDDDWVYIGVPNEMNPTGDHTFMFWIQNNKPSCQGQGEIISDYNEPPVFYNHLNLFYGGCQSDWNGLNCSNGNCLSYDFYGTNIVTEASSLDQNSWTHWAVVYNSSTLERNIYKNGDIVAQNTASGAYAGNMEIILGVEHNSNSGFQWDSALDAKFDDFSIWSKPLTYEEVQNYYYSSPNGLENDLEVFYNFNEGTDTTLTDQTSNDNDGIIMEPLGV